MPTIRNEIELSSTHPQSMLVLSGNDALLTIARSNAAHVNLHFHFLMIRSYSSTHLPFLSFLQGFFPYFYQLSAHFQDDFALLCHLPSTIEVLKHITI